MNIVEVEAFFDFYAEDYDILKVRLINGQILRLILIKGDDYDCLKQHNVWRAIEVNDVLRWISKQDNNLTTLFDGELIESIEPLV